MELVYISDSSRPSSHPTDIRFSSTVGVLCNSSNKLHGIRNPKIQFGFESLGFIIIIWTNNCLDEGVCSTGQNNKIAKKISLVTRHNMKLTLVLSYTIVYLLQTLISHYNAIYSISPLERTFFKSLEKLIHRSEIINVISRQRKKKCPLVSNLMASQKGYKILTKST